MIDKLTIDRIMDAAQIVDVVSEYVTLRRRGVNFLGLCPFHEDSKPSFSVSPSRNICKCFSCGEGGTAVHFIMKHEQLSYYEALKHLAKKYNIEIQEKELTDEQKKAYGERESMFIINEYARDYFTNILQNHVEGKSVGLSYFLDRGFRKDIIDKFQLGYSLEQRDAFSQEAMKAGYKQEYLVKTGLTIQGDNNYVADRFRGRVLFPVHTLSGKVAAFGGRILKKAENTGKYVNSPESPIYHKGNELYGIFFAKQAITKADNCFLVEGYTDVISMHQAGIENVVSSSGTALTKGQIRLIHRFTENITVLYDGDAAGIKAALRGIDLLLEDGLNVKVVLLPDGEDPDSFARKQNADSFGRYMKDNEVDFIQFKTKLLLREAGNDPIKKAALITDIVESIAIIPDNIIRTVYIKDCSILLSVDERILVGEVNKKRETKATQSATQQRNRPELEPPPIFIPDDIDQPNGAVRKPVRSKSPTDRLEEYVLYYVIRFGMDPLVCPDDVTEDNEDELDTTMTVLQYIRLDLERDNLWLEHPVYKQILDEALENSANPDFTPARYFLAHPDSDISQLAADVLSDKYELSKMHIKQYGADLTLEETPLAEEKHLIRNVPRALTELKYTHVCIKIDAIMKEAKKKQDEGDIVGSIELLTERQKLKEIQRVLDKILGERVIPRW